jgi:hypothetical protein
MASDHIRASDHDRDAVVATLRDAFSEGRLTLDEFQDRTTTAYAGRTWGDLRELTRDLPVQPSLGADLPPGRHPEAPDARPDARPGPQPDQQPDRQPDDGARPVNDLPPHLSQPGAGGPPPSARPRSQVGPVLPVLGIWVLFALATRSVAGAVIFVIAVVMIATFAAAARRR